MITGGTAPYNVFFQNPKPGATITPTTVAASGQTFACDHTHGPDALGANNITIRIQARPR